MNSKISHITFPSRKNSILVSLSPHSSGDKEQKFKFSFLKISFNFDAIYIFLENLFSKAILLCFAFHALLRIMESG